MEDASKDATRFTAHSLPSDPRLLATVTNAYLGTRVYHETLHVSGVYNGALGDTHRAILPSPLNVQLEAPAGTGEQLTKTYVLDTNTGSFLHTLEGPSFRASQRIYAHRTLPHVLAFSVSITRLAKGSWPVTVRLQSAFSPESPDLDLHLGPDFQGARYLCGHTLTPEQPGGAQQEVHMLWTPVPPALTLGEEQEDATWEFLTVVGGSQAEAQACLAEALQLQARHALYTTHAQAWAQLWADCGLDVEGPLALRQALRGALYYLLSALPQPGASGYVCHGLSPGGLSNGSREECYWGHVFWDQDLWVLPGLLLLHPEAAKALLQYRIRTLSGALDNARSLGYQGAKFAWESAGSGLEVCPEAIYGTQEIHVNGAVVLAFQLYYHTTQDLELFREAGGWDVVRAVAEFWCSRVEWNPEEEKYHLKGVMPPDEYHPGVNNSVYTNVLVQNSLRFAAALAQDLGHPVPNQWLVVADKIKVPFDPKLNFHPEFDGYQPGEEVKQADVVLLGYPVPFPLSPHVRRQNLEIYEAVTSPHGPAMTWVRRLRGVGWWSSQHLGIVPLASVSPPCAVGLTPACPLTPEHVCSGLDGAEGPRAGMGPPGEELRQRHRALQGVDGECRRVGCCELPDGHGGLPAGGALRGHGVQGSRLNFSVSVGFVTVEVTSQAGPWAPSLEAELWPSCTRLPLPPGQRVCFPCSAGRIQRSGL
ncbi:protein-glucosylgalactosylhydroxylysine glucosidase isoform X1 [Bubalus kerabau]|uniref:protein-glucosylgalactosylhydroxylysine glucosidase isoform X1 n=1 Tax=Bubalus carabanensis TaxID=3119969 RepID=UPI00244E94C1|nr:protein-glucosylgalactosylhydroxylysine glucosidase isoform X1 [Bubalus carabanensis]